MAFDEDFQPPTELRTDEFLLRPIKASDAVLDYEAVMESRDMLRIWEQSTWPADDFTVDANREDMELLEQRFADRKSFTYTVMDPSETSCLGCVYLYPSDHDTFTKSEITAAEQPDTADWSEYQAVLYFWVRASLLSDEVDQRLLDVLDPWLTRAWPIERYLVVTPEEFEQQVSMIERTGRTLKFRIRDEKDATPAVDLAFT